MSSVLKSFGKILLLIFVILYVLLEIFVTVCLLNFDDHRVTVLGKNTFLIPSEDLSDDMQKNDLLVVNKTSGDKVVKGDNIFFYVSDTEFDISYGKVLDVVKNGNAYIYQIDSKYNVYDDYYIGRDVNVYKKVGGVLKFLESKWGFLLLIVIPTLVAFIYEIYILIIEIIEYKKEVDNE